MSEECVSPLLFSDSFTFWHVRIVYYQGEKEACLPERLSFTNKIFTHWWMGILFPQLHLQRSSAAERLWREMSRLWSKIHSISPDLPQHRAKVSEEAIDQDFISMMYGQVLPRYLHKFCKVSTVHTVWKSLQKYLDLLILLLVDRSYLAWLVIGNEAEQQKRKRKLRSSLSHPSKERQEATTAHVHLLQRKHIVNEWKQHQ